MTTPHDDSPGRPKLEMRDFTVTVTVVPSNFAVAIGAAKIRKEKRVIRGYTLRDAKRRAGID